MNQDMKEQAERWLAEPESNRGFAELQRAQSATASQAQMVVEWVDNTSMVYYLKDHLGSVRVAVDETGAVVGYDDYDPWGLTLAGRSMATQSDLPNKFTGKELDDDYGLDWGYHGARFYLPHIGRWGSRDPFARKYPGLSPYTYVADNPLINFDPDGKDVWGVHFGAQIGLALGGGASFQFVYDTRLNKGTILFTFGGGAVAGITATGEVGVVYSSDTYKDLLGTSIELGADVSAGHGVGVAYGGGVKESEKIVAQNTSTGPKYKKTKGDKSTGKGAWVFSYSPGLSADFHAFKSKTFDIGKWFISLLTFNDEADEASAEDKNDQDEGHDQNSTPDFFDYDASNGVPPR